MPGVLKRADDRSDLMPNPAVVNEHLGGMNGQVSKKRKADELVNGDMRVNGKVALANGVHANGTVADAAISTETMTAFAARNVVEVPPEIEHITQGYLPLSKLIVRLSQDTFNDLSDAINEMADMQPSQPNGMPFVNGAGSVQTPQVNVRKKTRLWDFAQDRRAKFIKVLVLSQWSRQAESISRIIDLNYWINCQKDLYRSGVDWVGELKRTLGPVKMPNPDLETALETLSTGRAAWLPDLGYLPPESMSPQRLLKALRTINTLLTIRLNLHEVIPPALKNFSIQSGRVTFRVEDEFELDLSIADEDPSSQLFFIDFRFLFSPALTCLPEGLIRDQLEGKANDILRREGLTGCYDFLHDLVLTHKLRLLRSQATEMARGRWSENLRVEPMHRSLVVQYWLNRPGAKSWVEIGIKRGKQSKKLYSKEIGSPFISFRWHRHGKEVVDVAINMDHGNLSMEAILKQIISLHTNHIFRETKKRLREGAMYATKLLFLKHKASSTEPTDCSLQIQFTSSSITTMVQDPISGALAILPPSTLHSRIERDLNGLRDPVTECSARIANLRCALAMERAETCSRMLGWKVLRNQNTSQEVVKKLFGANIVRLAFFEVATWGKDWLLVYTASMAGDSWWVVELQNPSSSSDPAGFLRAPTQSIQNALKVSATVQGYLDSSTNILASVETTAAAMISTFIDIRELDKHSDRFILHTPTRSLSKLRVPDIVLRRRSQQSSIRPTVHRENEDWCHELVKSSFQGLSRSRASINSLVSARLIRPVPNINKLTSKMDSSLAFHPTSGTFAFRLNTSIGKTRIPAILERLHRIHRLVQFLEIIRRHDIPCQSVSMSELIFTYATDPFGPLAARITFASESPMEVFFPQSNPHLRIQDFLKHMLNEGQGFEVVICTLLFTLPLCRAFAAIESAKRTAGTTIHILPRSATWFRVKYGNPVAAYEIKLRQRDEQVLWFSMDTKRQEQSSAEDKAFKEAWDKLCRGRGQGWQGMKGGIKAEANGVMDLIMRIDAVFQELISADSGIKDDYEHDEKSTEVEAKAKDEQEQKFVVIDD